MCDREFNCPSSQCVCWACWSGLRLQRCWSKLLAWGSFILPTLFLSVPKPAAAAEGTSLLHWPLFAAWLHQGEPDAPVLNSCT